MPGFFFFFFFFFNFFFFFFLLVRKLFGQVYFMIHVQTPRYVKLYLGPSSAVGKYNCIISTVWPFKYYNYYL